MTAEQQLRALGISADVENDHVLIEVDRPFALYTTREIEIFHAHLTSAYREAHRNGRTKRPAPGGRLALVTELALEGGS